ncbi:MAG TPA: cytochrome c maturation protein CcmE, partial [Actinomycetota bacterium]
MGGGGKRARLILGVALIAAALGWVASRGLAGNLVYYRTPTEVVTEAVPGDRMRVGGLVVAGSVD